MTIDVDRPRTLRTLSTGSVAVDTVLQQRTDAGRWTVRLTTRDGDITITAPNAISTEAMRAAMRAYWGETQSNEAPPSSRVRTLLRVARQLVEHNWLHGPGFELPSDVRAVELQALVELTKAVALFPGDFS